MSRASSLPVTLPFPVEVRSERCGTLYGVLEGERPKLYRFDEPDGCYKVRLDDESWARLKAGTIPYRFLPPQSLWFLKSYVSF